MLYERSRCNASFRRALEENSWKHYNIIFLELLDLNLIKKGILHFLIAKLVYLQGALWKKQLIASFLEHFKWKSRKKFEAYFFSLIFPDLIRKKVIYPVFLAVMLNIVACGRNTLWRELLITKIVLEKF